MKYSELPMLGFRIAVGIAGIYKIYSWVSFTLISPLCDVLKALSQLSPAERQQTRPLQDDRTQIDRSAIKAI